MSDSVVKLKAAIANKRIHIPKLSQSVINEEYESSISDAGISDDEENEVIVKKVWINVKINYYIQLKQILANFILEKFSIKPIQ